MTQPNDFPDFCIRGLHSKDDLSDDGKYAGMTLFYPDERTANRRTDQGAETSVNWEDDATVMQFTLNQRKNDQLQFAWGAVQLPRSEVDRINSLPRTKDALIPERAPQADNPYHGNIVYNANLSKPTKKGIAQALALAASEVFSLPRPGR